MARRFARLSTFAVLLLGSIVLAHQLVYVVRYGSRYGEALAHAGHGDAWTAAVLTSALLALGLAALALARLAHLGLLVRRRGRLGEPARGQLQPGSLLRIWLRIAPRMALLSTLLLTLQENVERVAIGQAMPGVDVLFSPEYRGAFWITTAVALLVSLVAALVEWRHKVLVARLRRGRAPLPRAAASVVRRPERVDKPNESVIGRSSALRAPPPAPAAA